MAIRNLSCQSSLEPCVPEEDSPEMEELPRCHVPPSKCDTKPAEVPDETETRTSSPVARPDSLILSRTGDGHQQQPEKANRFLYRSNSTKSFRKPKPKVKSKKLSNEFDQIYVISSSTTTSSTSNERGEGGLTVVGANTAAGSNRYPNFYHARDDEYYDSIEVIHERRSKNFNKFNSVGGVNEDGPPILQHAENSETGKAGKLVPVGSNKSSVVADISPAPTANLLVDNNPDSVLPEEPTMKTSAIDERHQRRLSSTDAEEEADGWTKGGDFRNRDADHNGSIQRYDTVIHNVGASSSVDSEETPAVTISDGVRDTLDKEKSAEAHDEAREDGEDGGVVQHHDAANNSVRKSSCV